MTVVLLGLAVLGVAVAVLAVAELRRTSRGRWPHTLFAVTVVLLGIADQSELLPSSSLVQLAMIGSCAVAVLLILTGPAGWRSAPQPARCWSVGLLFLLWLDLFVTNTIRNNTLDLSSLAERLAPGAFWLAVLMLWLAGGIRRDLLAVVAALGVALIAVVTPVWPRSTRSCDEFKCNVLGELVRGPFSSENYPAMVAALTLVLVLACDVGRVRWPAAVLCVGLLVATGGRSSMIGAAVGVLVFLLVRRIFRDRTRTGPVVLLAIALPMVAAGTGLYMVYTAAADDLSNRGAIWVKAREALAGQEITGLGISRWSGYGHYSAISSHFPHSVYLLVLFCGGLIAIGLLMAAVSAGILGAAGHHRDLAAAAGFAAAYLTIGLSEIVGNPMTVDGLTWFLLPLVATGTLPNRPPTPQRPDAAVLAAAR